MFVSLITSFQMPLERFEFGILALPLFDIGVCMDIAAAEYTGRMHVSDLGSIGDTFLRPMR